MSLLSKWPINGYSAWADQQGNIIAAEFGGTSVVARNALSGRNALGEVETPFQQNRIVREALWNSQEAGTLEVGGWGTEAEITKVDERKLYRFEIGNDGKTLLFTHINAGSGYQTLCGTDQNSDTIYYIKNYSLMSLNTNIEQEIATFLDLGFNNSTQPEHPVGCDIKITEKIAVITAVHGLLWAIKFGAGGIIKTFKQHSEKLFFSKFTLFKDLDGNINAYSYIKNISLAIVAIDPNTMEMTEKFKTLKKLYLIEFSTLTHFNGYRPGRYLVSSRSLFTIGFAEITSGELEIDIVENRLKMNRLFTAPLFISDYEIGLLSIQNGYPATLQKISAVDGSITPFRHIDKCQDYSCSIGTGANKGVFTSIYFDKALTRYMMFRQANETTGTEVLIGNELADCYPIEASKRRSTIAFTDEPGKYILTSSRFPFENVDPLDSTKGMKVEFYIINADTLGGCSSEKISAGTIFEKVTDGETLSMWGSVKVFHNSKGEELVSFSNYKTAMILKKSGGKFSSAASFSITFPNKNSALLYNTFPLEGIDMVILVYKDIIEVFKINSETLSTSFLMSYSMETRLYAPNSNPLIINGAASFIKFPYSEGYWASAKKYIYWFPEDFDESLVLKFELQQEQEYEELNLLPIPSSTNSSIVWLISEAGSIYKVDLDDNSCCNPACKSCFGLGSKQCLPNCRDGYYTRDNGLCSKCSANCETCSSENNCLTCSSLRLLEEGRCVDSCSQGFFKETASQCKKCQDDCETCLTSESCNTCPNNKLMQEGRCIDSCSIGYFKSSLTLCSKCPSDCLTCSSDRVCLTCDENHLLEENTCKTTCSESYFRYSTNSCKKCSSNCLSCSEEAKCLSCPQGQLLEKDKCVDNCSPRFYKKDYVCEECDSTCLNCSGPTSYDCLSCSDKKILFKGVQCLDYCPDTYILEAKNNTCICPELYIEENGRCYFEISEELGPVALLVSEYSASTHSIILEFNVSIVEIDAVKDLNFSIIQNNFSRPIEPEKGIMNLKGISIVFKLNETYKDAMIQITPNDPSKVAKLIKNKASDSSVYTGFPIDIKGINFFTSNMAQTIISSAGPASVAIKTATTAVMVGGFPIYLSTVKCFQVLEFVTYINIDFPENVRGFFGVFQFELTEIIPNPLSIEEDQNKVICNLHPRMKENGISCLFQNNMGSQTLQLLLVILVWGVFSLLRIAFTFRNNSKNSRIFKFIGAVETIIRFISSIVSPTMIMEYMMTVQIQNTLAAVYSIKTAKFSEINREIKISLLLSTLMIILFVAHFGIILYVSIIYQFKKIRGKFINKEKEEKTIIKKYSWIIKLYESYRDLNGYEAVFLFSNIIRDIIFPLILIFAIETPLLQIIPMTIFLLLKCVVNCIVRPFKRRFDNIFQISIDVLYSLIFVFCLLIEIKKDSWDGEKKFNYLGYPTIGVMAIFTVFVLSYALFKMIISVGKKTCFRGKEMNVLDCKVKNSIQGRESVGSQGFELDSTDFQKNTSRSDILSVNQSTASLINRVSPGQININGQLQIDGRLLPRTLKAKKKLPTISLNFDDNENETKERKDISSLRDQEPKRANTPNIDLHDLYI